jgi:molybdopterin-binding protein
MLRKRPCSKAANFPTLRPQSPYFKEHIAMKVSARNVLPATVKTVTPGAVDSEVVMELAPGIEVVSIITKISADKLRLKPGAKVYAIIKAPNVMIGVD